MNTILLTIAALAPAIVLAVYIYKKDSAEKEPAGLLLKLLICGIIIAWPVVQVESIFDSTIYHIFLPVAEEQGGTIVLFGFWYYLYQWVKNTIGIALVEEGFKFLALYLVTSKNKNFNSLFDGVIYSVFVSLGFAGFENILYCFQYGWGTAISRMVTAVPAHTFFGILMGFCYTIWHVLEKAKEREIQFAEAGMIKRNNEYFSGKGMLVLALVIPTLIHGFYDFCCSIGEAWANILFYLLMIGLYKFCFSNVRKLSRADQSDMRVVDGMLIGKYPELLEKNKDEEV